MKILAIRLSAMGDATLCLPAFRTVLNQNQNCSIDFLTNPHFEPIFNNIPGLKVLSFNVRKDYSGIIGLWRLFRILRRSNYDLVIDLHHSLRTRFLQIFFFLSQTKFFQIQKDRKIKNALLGNIHHDHTKLKHTVSRYQAVFQKAGLLSSISIPSCKEHGIVFNEVTKKMVDHKCHNLQMEGLVWIGIAPFAQHGLKEIPISKIQELISLLCKIPNFKIILFGAGTKELDGLLKLQLINPKSIIISSRHFTLAEELFLMSKLNGMITMDSANLHLAELAGCPKVISIWGPTHSALGFEPFISGQTNILEIPAVELNCRPCSVFGNKACQRGDHACMNWISVSDIFSKIIHT